MSSENPENDFLFLPVKTINIPNKFLTIGIQEKKEEELDITKGKINVISLIGDEDMYTLFLSLMLARVSIVDMGTTKPSKMAIIHPETFSILSSIKKYYEYFISSNGNEDSISATWHPVSNANDSISKIRSTSCDIIVDLFSDAFLDSSKVSNAYMDALDHQKSEKFILIFRFSRKKLVITKRSDNEVVIEAKKGNFPIDLNPFNINRLRMRTRVGTYKINLKDGNRILYSLIYPFFITS